MENKESQILSEIMTMMASLRSQMDLLEAKVVELQSLAGQEDTDMTPIDLDLDDIASEPEVSPESVAVEEPEVEEPVETAEDLLEPEVVEEPVATVEPEDDDLPFEEIPEPSEEPVEAGLEEAVEPEQEDDDLPVFMEPEPVEEPVVEPVSEPEPVVEAKPAVAVIDSMTDRQAWRTDMPGSPVRDIRSAISLNDRILFINGLFAQDPMAFQDTLTRINQMESLEDVIAYVVAERPEWDLESEIVYRFMMAVRRKVK